MNVRSISVCLPVFNEEDNIVRAVTEAATALTGLCDRPEIVAVDDASTDGTAVLLQELGREVDFLRTFRLPVNTRYAGALKRALAEATGEVLFYTDSDCPVDMGELRGALPLLNDADVVSGFRTRRGEGVRRAITSLGYNLLIGSLFDLDLRDVNFAFKLFRREVIEAVEARSSGSFIDAEFLLEAHRLGFRIVQTGVEYHPRTGGASTLLDAGIVARCLRDVVAYRLGLPPWSAESSERP